MFSVILRWYGRWLHYRKGRALYRCVRVTLASSTAERTAHSRPDSNWQEVSWIPTGLIFTTRGWRCSGRRLLLVGALAKPPPRQRSVKLGHHGEAGRAPGRSVWLKHENRRTGTRVSGGVGAERAILPATRLGGGVLISIYHSIEILNINLLYNRTHLWKIFGSMRRLLMSV